MISRLVGHPPTPGEVAALAAGIVAFIYLAWDNALWDARLQLLLHLVALGGGLGMLAVAARGGWPRSPLWIPILLLLAVIGIASIGGVNPGLSARAFASSLATAAMLPVALLAVQRRAAWVGLVTAVPVLLLVTGTLLYMLPRRVAWVAHDGPGLLAPRLGAEGTPFGSVAVPPFVIMAVLPLTFLVDEPRARRFLQAGLLAIGIPLTLISGSRSAWLAIAVTAVAFTPALLPRLRPTRLRPAHLVAAALAAIAAGLALMAVFPRLTAVTSLLYRGDLWRDSLAALDGRLLLGIGPGSMPYARMAAAEPFSLPVRQPHSHNLPLGILGDAGIAGLAAAAVLVMVFAVVAGPWRQRTWTGRTAIAVLAGFAVAGLFEDLTFVPGFNLLVLLLVAVALIEAGAVRWTRLRIGWPVAVPLAAGVVAVAAIGLVGDAAAASYRTGVDAFAGGREEQAQRWLTVAERVDPWHPAHPKGLAVVASTTGNHRLAREAAQRAVDRNPGDGPSWVTLAYACLELRDDDCAARAARQALERSSGFGLEAINAALVLDALGDSQTADEAYRFSLLISFATGLAHEWPREVDVGYEPALGVGSTNAQVNLVIGRATQGQQTDPARISDPIALVLAHAFAGDWPAAERGLERAMREAPELPMTWDLAFVLAERRGDDPTRALRLGEVIRGRPLSPRAQGIGRLGWDIGSFRIYPLGGYPPQAERLIPDPPMPWAIVPYFGDASDGDTAGDPFRHVSVDAASATGLQPG